MKFIGASSLSRTIKATSGPARRRLESQCIAIPGLSANTYGKFKRKTVQHLLENTTLKFEKEIVIWHDVLNNSLSKHSSNFNRPLSPKQLIGQLKKYPQIRLVVFCPRHGARDIFQQLCSAKIPTFNVLKYIFPDIKNAKASLVEKYYELHQPASQELKTFSLVELKLSSPGVAKAPKSANSKNRHCKPRRLRIRNWVVKNLLARAQRNWSTIFLTWPLDYTQV